MSQDVSCGGMYQTGADGGAYQFPSQGYDAHFATPSACSASPYAYDSPWTGYEQSSYQAASPWHYGDAADRVAHPNSAATASYDPAGCGYFSGGADGSSWSSDQAGSQYVSAFPSNNYDSQFFEAAGSFPDTSYQVPGAATSYVQAAAPSGFNTTAQASYTATSQSSYPGFDPQPMYGCADVQLSHQVQYQAPLPGAGPVAVQHPDMSAWSADTGVGADPGATIMPDFVGSHQQPADAAESRWPTMPHQTFPALKQPDSQQNWVRSDSALPQPDQRQYQQSPLSTTPSPPVNHPLPDIGYSQGTGVAASDSNEMMTHQQLEAQMVAKAAAEAREAEARAALAAAEAAAAEVAQAKQRLAWLNHEAEQKLPSPFLTARELSMRPDELLKLLPCNTIRGPYISELVYLYTHFMLLRYDTFSDLHVKVHTLRTALRHIPSLPEDPVKAAWLKDQLTEDLAKLAKAKAASLLKTAKGYFFGVRIIGIIFEKPPPPERTCRNQRQQPRPAPALLVEWDVVQTAEKRRLVCDVGSKPATHGAVMRAMTEHQIERMDMVVISTADDCFSRCVFYATVVEVLDQYGQSVLRQEGGKTNARRGSVSSAPVSRGRWGKPKEEPHPCRLLLEFVPLSAMGEICELSLSGCEFVVVHFPVLLLSVLPMLENIQSLHERILKKQLERGMQDKGKKGKGKWRKGEGSGKSRFHSQDVPQETSPQQLHYSDLLVKLKPPPRHPFGGVPGPGKIAALADITEDKLEDFMTKNSVDASQAEAMRMCFQSPFGLIQGPPGTGKTHVARLIVKFIVEQLKEQWRKVAWEENDEMDESDGGSIRILAMAYKNMSLDNLCRGCIPFLPKGRADILRLGSKSNSTESPFTSQTEARQMYSHLPEFAGFNVGSTVRMMDSVQTELDALLERIRNATTDESHGHILCWEAFIEGASEEQRDSLRTAGWSRDLRVVVYDEWLCPNGEESLPASAADGANLHEVLDGVLARIGMSLKTVEETTSSIKSEAAHGGEDRDDDEDEEDLEADEEDERAQLRRELMGRMQQRGLARGAPQDAIIRIRVGSRKDISAEDDLSLFCSPDLFALPVAARHRLASAWQRSYLDRHVAQLSNLLDMYEAAQKAMLSSVAERTAWLASKFMVTALTVTRSAMDRELLAHIRPHIIIVEEAAEILEANMVGGLLIGHSGQEDVNSRFDGGLSRDSQPWKNDEKGWKKGDDKGLKGDSKGWKGDEVRGSYNDRDLDRRSTIPFRPQVILIGDHKQLQPAVQSQDLELELRFGLSMFERLASNGLAVATLQHQRRMHDKLTPLHDWIYAAEGVQIINAVENNRPIITGGGSKYLELPGLRLIPYDDEWSKQWSRWREDVDRWENWDYTEESAPRFRGRRRRRASREDVEEEPPPPEPLPATLAHARGSRSLFIAHNSEEDVEGLSPRNEDEAAIVCALVHYFVQVAGVKVENITVLTPYKGQLFVLRHMIRALQLKDAEKELPEGQDSQEEKKPKFVDVQTVDTFQGEENDIIILSLTRCRRLTRFLRTQNRLCVSVSRARCGFVLVGNPALLTELEDWKHVLRNMEVASHSGEAEEMDTCVLPAVEKSSLRASTLYLACPNHSNVECPSSDSCMTLSRYAKALYPEDQRHQWSKISSGQPTWASSWHYPAHHIFQCKEKCRFRCHAHGGCRKLCHDHNVCQTLVEKTLPCGHTGCYPCFTDVATASCEKWVQATRNSCGHEIRVRCGVDPDGRCTEQR